MVAANNGTFAQSPSKKAKHTAGKPGAAAARLLGDRSAAFDNDDDVGTADFEVKSFDEGAVDGMLLMVLKQLRPHASRFEFKHDAYESTSSSSSSSSSSPAASQSFKDLCHIEIKRQEVLKTEVAGIMAAWDRYSDLLKAHDELEQCKTRTALNVSPPLGKGAIANRFDLAAERAGALRPYELAPAVQTAYAAATLSENELKKTKGSLQFYKEQVREIFAEAAPDDDLAEFELAQKNATCNAADSGSSSPSHRVDNERHTAKAVQERERILLTSPTKSIAPTCLICREDLVVAVTANTPSKHNRQPTDEAGPKAVSISAEDSADPASLEVVLLPCAHRFHRECVTRWVRKHRNCPLCKAPATLQELIAVAQIAPAQVNMIQNNSVQLLPQLQAIGHVGSTSSSSSSSSSVAVATGRPPLLSPVGPAATGTGITPSRRPHSKLKGKWGTKVDTLVTDLLELTEDIDRQDEKAIVFSQWVEVNHNFFFI